MTTPKKEMMVPRKVVVGGLRLDRKGGRMIELFPLGDDDALGDPVYYSAPRRSPITGGIYEVNALADYSRMELSGMRFQSRYPDAERIAGWELESEQSSAILAIRKREKEAAKDSFLADVLAPIRERYVRSNAEGRAALEVVVLRYLRKGV